MLTELAEAVERTEIGGFGSDLVEGFALVDRLMAKLTVAVGSSTGAANGSSTVGRRLSPGCGRNVA